MSSKEWCAENRARNAICLPTGSKICTGCKMEKDFSEYHKLLSLPDGRQVRCKLCTRIRYEENRERRLTKLKERRAADPEKFKADRRAWYLRNRARMRAWWSVYTKKNKHRLWYKLNKTEMKRIWANQNARRRGAEGSHTKEEISAMFKVQRGICANQACRVSLKSGYHEDHITPIIRGGSNYIRNIQLLCPMCNMKKGATDPIAWAQENGLLL